MSFGEWLRKQLHDGRVSNAELARRIDVSATYVGYLVRDFSPNTRSGKGRPSEEVVERIAAALDADVDDARQAAGYLPKRLAEKPHTVEGLILALRTIGIEIDDIPQLYGGLADDPDLLERVKDDIRTVTEMNLQRMRPRRRSRLIELEIQPNDEQEDKSGNDEQEGSTDRLTGPTSLPNRRTG